MIYAAQVYVSVYVYTRLYDVRPFVCVCVE